jgi:hypothetical protein
MKLRNVLGFIVYCGLLLSANIMVFLSLDTSRLADVNAGVITVFWNFDTIILALTDWIVFGHKMTL